MEGNSVPINYVSKSLSGKLKLIQGDGDTLSDVLGLINEYEGKSDSRDKHLLLPLRPGYTTNMEE